MAKSAKTKRAKPTRAKRGSDAPLFSISGASEALSRSRRTITHALANVKPAKIVSGLRLWHMRDVIAAVNTNTMAPLLTGNGISSHSDFTARFDAAMRAWDEGFAALEREPDLERRRALNERLGVSRMIGPLDRLMKEQGEAMGESEEGCLAFISMDMIGKMISNILTLWIIGRWWMSLSQRPGAESGHGPRISSGK